MVGSVVADVHRHLLRGVLLDPDGIALRRRRDEPAVDRRDIRLCPAGEDNPHRQGQRQDRGRCDDPRWRIELGSVGRRAVDALSRHGFGRRSCDLGRCASRVASVDDPRDRLDLGTLSHEVKLPLNRPGFENV